MTDKRDTVQGWKGWNGWNGWKGWCVNGVYFAITNSKAEASNLYHALREQTQEYPTPRANFVLRPRTGAELAFEIHSPFVPSDKRTDYSIVPCRVLPKSPFQITVDGKVILWNGNHLLHDETQICNRCFKEGQLTLAKECTTHSLKRCRGPEKAA